MENEINDNSQRYSKILSGVTYVGTFILVIVFLAQSLLSFTGG